MLNHTNRAARENMAGMAGMVRHKLRRFAPAFHSTSIVN